MIFEFTFKGGNVSWVEGVDGHLNRGSGSNKGLDGLLREVEVGKESRVRGQVTVNPMWPKEYELQSFKQGNLVIRLFRKLTGRSLV